MLPAFHHSHLGPSQDRSQHVLCSGYHIYYLSTIAMNSISLSVARAYCFDPYSKETEKTAPRRQPLIKNVRSAPSAISLKAGRHDLRTARCSGGWRSVQRGFSRGCSRCRIEAGEWSVAVALDNDRCKHFDEQESETLFELHGKAFILTHLFEG